MSVVVSWRTIERGRRAFGAVAVAAGVLMIAAPVHAQSQSAAMTPSLGPLTAVSAEWLQIGTGSLYRNVTPSLAITVAHDHLNGLRLEVGYLRAVRRLSTVNGATGGISMPLTHGRLTVRPGIGALVGRAVTAVDEGGYAWQSDTPDSTETGYQSHRRYMRETTVGGAVNLSAELQVIRALAITASIRQWIFTGDAIRQNRTPMLAGLGLSFHPGAVVRSRVTPMDPDR